MNGFSKFMNVLPSGHLFCPILLHVFVASMFTKLTSAWLVLLTIIKWMNTLIKFPMFEVKDKKKEVQEK